MPTAFVETRFHGETAPAANRCKRNEHIVCGRRFLLGRRASLAGAGSLVSTEACLVEPGCSCSHRRPHNPALPLFFLGLRHHRCGDYDGTSNGVPLTRPLLAHWVPESEVISYGHGHDPRK